MTESPSCDDCTPKQTLHIPCSYDILRSIDEQKNHI